MYKKLKEQITETTQYYLLRNVQPEGRTALPSPRR